MSEYYFDKLPIIEYGNTTCRDISRNVRLLNLTRKTPNNFYPYEVKEGTRSDVLAHAYYDDSYYDWLIYLTNGIVDPYYGWYLDYNDFNEYIKKKYGTIEDAQDRIKYYQIKVDLEDTISVDHYENQLAEPLKKYYVPEFGQNTKILNYKKRNEEWRVNTNQILNFVISANTTTSFSNNELATIYHNEIPTGNCEIIYQNSDEDVLFANGLSIDSSIGNTILMANIANVKVFNINGNTSDISGNTVIIGRNSNTIATILQSSVLKKNIDDEEFVYWEGVRCYDYENEKNEAKKYVTLLDAAYAIDVSEELRKKMKE